MVPEVLVILVLVLVAFPFPTLAPPLNASVVPLCKAQVIPPIIWLMNVSSCHVEERWPSEVYHDLPTAEAEGGEFPDGTRKAPAPCSWPHAMSERD